MRSCGRWAAGIAAAALGLAVVTACAPSSRRRTDTTPSANAPRATFGVVSATFISPRTGWALGVRRCHQAGCPRLALRTTSDGGRHWLAVPAPPSAWIYQRPCCPSRAAAVSSIRFADRRNGWAFGPGLWATHDGGRTWHQVTTHGWPVEGLAAADGRVVAVFTRGRRFRVWSSPESADRWRPVPSASGAGFQPSLALAAGTGYLAVSHQPNRAGQPAPTSVLLTGPANGSASWRQLVLPCPAWTLTSLAAAAAGSLAVACAGQPGAGAQRKQAYLSPDHGRTWHGAASTTPSLNPAYQAGEALTATMTTSSQGLIVAPDTPYPTPPQLNVGKIWLTHDDGHAWQLITIR